jgi:hypothetical protein
LAEITGFRGSYDAAIRREADPKLNTQADRLLAHARDAVTRGTPKAIKDAEASLREAIALAQSDLLQETRLFGEQLAEIVTDGHRSDRLLAADSQIT